MKHSGYVVTLESFNLQSGQGLRNQFWDGESPLLLGSPVRWILESTDSTVRVRDLGLTSHSGKLKMEPARIQEHPHALDVTLKVENLNVRIRAARDFTKFKTVDVPVEMTGRGMNFHDGKRFSNALKVSGGAAGLLLLVFTLWPTAKHQDLIPPQFAKIVLESKKEFMKKRTVPPRGSSGKIQVVQAFRDSSLKSAATALLKGGMSRLLTQADFAMGRDSSEEARRIFSGKSNALRSTAPVVGLSDRQEIKVAALGGGTGGEGKSVGKGVGYGKGEHAAITGQGKSFVAMDTSGSLVEEGLTRDEVGEVIHRHLSEVRYCYEASMIRAPNVEGKLMMGFTIGESGSVRTAEVRSSTLSDPKLDDCILRRLLGWKFPKTKGGVDVAVTYPFIFKSLGG